MAPGVPANPFPFSIGQCAALACLLEVAAPKVGNVHRGADFEDLTFNDFLVSAIAIAPSLGEAPARGVGPTVLAAIRATRARVDTNTNLGTVLLLAPLAAVPADRPLGEGIGYVLDSLSARDAEDIYAAIRLAAPGGLGQVDSMDVAGPPPESILDAMQAAADRDLVARQYTNRFAQVLAAADWLVDGRQSGRTLTDSIVHTHVRLMAGFPDSLIRRKCGPAVADQAARRAASVLRAEEAGREAYQQALSDLDFWLRSDRHRRNPGTTADLIAAALFVVLREGRVSVAGR